MGGYLRAYSHLSEMTFSCTHGINDIRSINIIESINFKESIFQSNYQSIKQITHIIHSMKSHWKCVVLVVLDGILPTFYFRSGVYCQRNADEE